MMIKNLNPSLKELQVDHLYHLGLDTNMDLKSLFGDVRFVCMGGSPERACAFAHKVANHLRLNIPQDQIKPLGKTERFSLYKVGPVISVSHGMGMPSISILMHEITKLLYYADCQDPVLMRIGTSGGLGVEPGTVVLTEEALNAALKSEYEIMTVGRVQTYGAKLNRELNQKIKAASPQLSVVTGKTVAANCFYEEQARLDGALDPGYSLKDKEDYLRRAHQMGVVNFEMESLQFAAFCHRAGLKGAVICVTLVDRLKGDQITASHDELASYSDRSQEVALNFIKSCG